MGGFEDQLKDKLKCSMALEREKKDGDVCNDA